MSHPGIGFVVARYCPLWAPFSALTGPKVLVGTLAPHERVALIPNCHISDQLRRSTILSALGLLSALTIFSYDSEASELPKGLVLNGGGHAKVIQPDLIDPISPILPIFWSKYPAQPSQGKRLPEGARGSSNAGPVARFRGGSHEPEEAQGQVLPGLKPEFGDVSAR
ncbi:unnamed protein product [Prunus armeniaca]